MTPHTSHLRPDGTTFPPVTPDPPPPPGYVDPVAELEPALSTGPEQASGDAVAEHGARTSSSDTDPLG
jgi:hypothetical protein